MDFDQRTPVFLDLGFRQNQLPSLRAYLELLWSSNQELNLISRQMSYEALIDNHLIDSLLPLRFFPPDLKVVADLGSGGGLPAVIFALQFPEVSFHLFEKSPRKREFLNRCKQLAPNLKIHGEISALENVDLVTARAFKPVDVILDMTRPYYSRGGVYFLLKGRKEKIEDEVRLARKKFKDLQVSIEALSSPVLAVERNLVQIRSQS